MIRQFAKKSTILTKIYKKFIYYKNFSLFIKDYFNYKKLSKNNNRFLLSWKNRKVCLSDNTKNTNFDRHYIYHPAWAARILSKTQPKVHIDISSTLHFCSIVSAFIPIKFYDYRPANLKLDNLTSESADLLSLPFSDNSIKSLSCMHTIEHIGLGRYGDKLNPDGDLKAISELKRVLAVGGNLLFVAPIGKPKIMFNAQRIYSYDNIINYFKEFKLKNFSLVLDNTNNKNFIWNAKKEEADKQKYGCGCFWFKKL